MKIMWNTGQCLRHTLSATKAPDGALQDHDISLAPFRHFPRTHHAHEERSGGHGSHPMIAHRIPFTIINNSDGKDFWSLERHYTPPEHVKNQTIWQMSDKYVF